MPARLCTVGTCVCPAATPIDCGGTCVDPLKDKMNCGRCGVTCANDEACVNGACVLSCGLLTKCNGKCKDAKTDPQDCGGCGIACPPNNACTLLADNTISCLGYNAYGQIGDGMMTSRGVATPVAC